MGYNIDGIKPSFNELHLRKNLSIPSTVHGYSLAIEYMRNWILSKYTENFFKTVHINGKHVLADYRKFKNEKVQPITKPAVAIMPGLNPDYNRDNVDLIQGGLNIYTVRTKCADFNFLSDYDNNVFLALQMKQIEMPFNFKIRVESRAQQLDMLEFTRIACRIGSTQGEYMDYDCHVPYDIMLAIAIDNGFEIYQDDKGTHIKDIISFLHYLNGHSKMYFTYKLRTINGRHEFFIRIEGAYVHISCLDGISMDDGERHGSLDANYHVEFTATVKFPVPAFFVYYSQGNHRIVGKELQNVDALYQIVTVGPPEKDEHNWGQYFTTQWSDPDKKLSSIYFKDLVNNDKLMKVIKYNIQIGLSPAVFMSIKMYNGQRELPIRIDWQNYTIYSKQQDVPDELTDIAFYVDLNYINNTLAHIEELDKDRLRLSEKQ